MTRSTPLGVSSGSILLNKIFSKIAYSNGCWLWTAGKESDGYGIIWAYGKSRRVPRLLYEMTVGVVPEGLVLDHICHTRDPGCVNWDACPHRACINPGHLEPVTNRENILRGVGNAAKNAQKTHCKNGHELSGENLMMGKPNKHHPRGQRYCKICYLDKAARYRVNNLEKVREYDRKWKQMHRAKL